MGTIFVTEFARVSLVCGALIIFYPRRDRRLLKLLCIFSKCLFAFLARKGHVKGLQEWVVCLFLVAFGAVEPFSALIDVH